MISYGPNLGLMIDATTGEAHDAALRAFLRGVDGLVMPNAKGYLTNTPPGSPSDGDLYIIGAAPTGAWAGQGGKVTRWSSVANAWEFYTPKNGWMFQSNSAREVYRYTGGAWEIFYKEGTFTPSLSFSSGSVTYSEQLGRYTIIGTHVHAVVRLVISGVSSPLGMLTLVGLPTKSKNDGIFTPSLLGVGGLAGVSNVWASVVPGASYAQFYGHTPSSVYALLSASCVQPGAEISASISYEA